jgi:KTSC domain
MEMISVSSSNIEAIGYDTESETLQIQFKNGSTYQYFDVPETVFEQLRDASSVGAYLSSNIKGVFRFSRV